MEELKSIERIFLRARNEKIQQTEDFIVYKGYLPSEQEIAVKKYLNGKGFLKEIEILKKLRNAEFFVKYIFFWSIYNDHKVAFEYYETADKSEVIFETSEIKHATTELFKGLGFLHENNISHGNISKSNIAIVTKVVNLNLKMLNKYKLINFDKATKKPKPHDFRNDIEILVQLFTSELDSNYDKNSCDVFTYSLYIDLIKYSRSDRKVSDILKHPFFYATQDTLNFIMKFCIKLENIGDAEIKKLDAFEFDAMIPFSWIGRLKQIDDKEGNDLYEHLNENQRLYNLNKTKNRRKFGDRGENYLKDTWIGLAKIVRNLVL